MNSFKIYKDDKLKISAVVLGLLSNNVYMLESGENTTIVDPSCGPENILEFVGDRKLNDILLTHYHFDHVGAAFQLKETTGANTYASKIDTPFINGSKPAPMTHRKVVPCPVDKVVCKEDKVTLGKITWTVIETPGHTMGSICYFTEETNTPILICGDTLFYESCGRVDFPDSSPEAMRDSLKKLSKLPDNTLVLPGHGPSTSIEHERMFMLR